MDISHKTRRRFALLVLLVGLPIYIVLAGMLAEWIGRRHVLVELGIYLVLGVIWALPLRFLFLGVAREDPDAPASRRDRRN